MTSVITGVNKMTRQEAMKIIDTVAYDRYRGYDTLLILEGLGLITFEKSVNPPQEPKWMKLMKWIGETLDPNSGYRWCVFQRGHLGWWYTDGYGIECRTPYSTQGEAAAAMVERKSAQERDQR